MIVILNGQEWPWDEDSVTVEEALALETACVMSWREFRAGWRDGRAGAWRALVWLLRWRAGETTLTVDQVSFRMNDLLARPDPVKAEATPSPPEDAAPR